MAAWRKKKKDLSPNPEMMAARAAEQRALDTITTVQTREIEVNRYQSNLQMRKQQNNFGRALEIAMEKKRYA